MSATEIWVVAVGLAMDCMAVSIAGGILIKRFRGRPMLTLSFFFGVFQGVMPLIGVSFACLGIGRAAIMGPAGIIGLVAFLLSLVGFSAGILFGRSFNFRAGLLGGVILIGIGSKILVEHLF